MTAELHSGTRRVLVLLLMPERNWKLLVFTSLVMILDVLKPRENTVEQRIVYGSGLMIKIFDNFASYRGVVVSMRLQQLSYLVGHGSI